jgi:predicted regulator of Ras-like GTPase activity (Roadblock/LC7/MglB family)
VSFEAILRDIVDNCSGAIGAALMETDGIGISQVNGPTVAGDPLGGDIGSAGVEFGRIIGEITKASDALGGGMPVETVVTLARFTLIFHHIDADVMLVMALAPSANLGKARYLIRRNSVALRQEL